MASPLCHGVSHVSAIVSATVPAVAVRLPGASGAVAARLLVTAWSVNAAAGLLLRSWMGFDDGTV